MRDDTNHRSESGSVLSADSWLEDHFEACVEPYAAMVDAAALPSGGRVLDLGCGTGTFVALLREAVGPVAEIVAVDLDVANVSQIGRHDASTDAVVGSALQLPFADGTFDAVWSANLTQYFDDADLEVLLAEVARVARPGAPIAVKDVDMSALRIFPGDAFLGPHLAEACAVTPPVSSESVGSIRGRALRGWLQRAGLEETWQRTFAIEYLGPLEGSALRLWAAWLPYLARLASEKGVSEADLVTWETVVDPAAAAAFVQRDEFYGCEVQVLAVGRKPNAPRRD